MTKRLGYKPLQICGLTLLLCQAHAVQLRDNYFCDTNKSQLSFKPANDSDWYSITDGEPFETDINNVEGEINCLNIKAGRKNSKKNVKWVQEKLKYLGVPWREGFMMPTTYFSAATPAELNFAIMGTLTYKHSGVTAVCDNVIIAEGHVPFFMSNNMWIFNNNNDFKNTLKCYDPANQQAIYLQIKEACTDRVNHDYRADTAFNFMIIK